MSSDTYLIPSYWDQVEDKVFYLKSELYMMNWDVSAASDLDLSALTGVGAPFGGPIAMKLDSSKMVIANIANKWRDITVFTAAGKLLTKIANPQRVKAIGWTMEVNLITVREDGRILIHDTNGKFLNINRPLSFGPEIEQVLILDAKIFTDVKTLNAGVAVMTTNYSFRLAVNVDEENSTIRAYPDVPELDHPPSCWCVYFPDRVHACILVANDTRLYTLRIDGDGGVEEKVLSTKAPVNSFVAVALSMDHKHIALLTDTGVIWIGSADLRNRYLEFSTGTSKYYPKDFVWCGTTGVLLYYKEMEGIFLIDRQGGLFTYKVPGDVILIGEVDGVRILSADTHEFIQKIPESVENIASIQSSKSGVHLLLAAEYYEMKESRISQILDALRSDGESLEDAVDQCIAAASDAYYQRDQEKLLRAAALGRNFIEDFSSTDRFTSTCRTLRVLNCLRDENVGMPLTYKQFEVLTSGGKDKKVLINRLMNRRLWPLAMKVCEDLEISEENGASYVKKHWACWKVSQPDSKSIPDKSLAELIRNKIGNAPGISYQSIAKKAVENGRNELAILLLDYETRATEQIDLLLDLRKFNVALEKALDSGDPYVINEVILKLSTGKMDQVSFQNLIANNKRALVYYMKYLKLFNRDMLFQLHGQSDDFQSQALMRVEESYNEITTSNKISALKDAKLDFGKARSDFFVQVASDQIDLYKKQQRLEDEMSRPRAFMGLSLHQTVVKLVSEGKLSKADEMHKEFKIPDKKFWWMKIEGLADRGDWFELEKFSKSKKSPIGFVPFVEVCLQRGNKIEAEKYIQKVPTDERVIPYLKAGDMKKAAEQAFVNKNEEELKKVYNCCSQGTPQDRAFCPEVMSYISKLQN